jgi:NAD(P)-dependent dehydrogenase (short-subunit alcohol dehydrogenase family)
MTSDIPTPLRGKLALVAGACGGIRLEIARALARAGARLLLLGRSPERIDAAARGIVETGGMAQAAAVDLREYDPLCETIADALDRAGPPVIDIVICGAAGDSVTAAQLLSPEGFRGVLDLDLVATYNVMRACYPFLARPGASLIGLCAPLACIPHPMQAHLAAARGGVEMLTRSLALEWGPEGVRVNAIVPGPIAGGEGLKRAASAGRDLVARSVPLRRYGTAAELADLALFLASPAAQYITGAVIPCDGGLSLMGPDAFGRARAAEPSAAA